MGEREGEVVGMGGGYGWWIWGSPRRANATSANKQLFRSRPEGRLSRGSRGVQGGTAPEGRKVCLSTLTPRTGKYDCPGSHNHPLQRKQRPGPVWLMVGKCRSGRTPPERCRVPTALRRWRRAHARTPGKGACPTAAQDSLYMHADAACPSAPLQSACAGPARPCRRRAEQDEVAVGGAGAGPPNRGLARAMAPSASLLPKVTAGVQRTQAAASEWGPRPASAAACGADLESCADCCAL